MSLHPQYLKIFTRCYETIMKGDGPLPFHYRHYIAIMVISLANFALLSRPFSAGPGGATARGRTLFIARSAGRRFLSLSGRRVFRDCRPRRAAGI